MHAIVKALNRLEEAVLAGGLMGLAFMAFIEVVTRYLFSHSFTWFEEFARYFCVFLTFLGASLGIKYGMHFSMDFVVTRVSYRVGHIMRMASNAISGSLFGIVAWLALRHALKLKGFGTTSAAMGLPMFWAYLPIALFSATMVLRFAYQIFHHAKLMAAGEPLAPRAEAPAAGQDDAS